MSDEENTVDGEAEEITDAPLPVVQAPSASTALVARDEINVAELVAQSDVIYQAMRQAMTEGIHYGRIPGVQKPTLLKPGAEKLLVLFRLAPAYQSDKIWHDDGHLTVSVKCILHHIPTGLKVAEGEGLCTSRESRYAYRKGERTCPECGKATVREGKPRNGRPGNWYCWNKAGVSDGCGATWDLDSEQGALFKGMDTGRVDNPDLPDTYNTVLKMADKRALLAAILNGTAASDVFTQDMEDAGGGASGAPEGDSRILESQQQQAPKEQEPWHPAKSYRDDAPRGGWKKISEFLIELDGSVDWGPLVRQAIASVYGGDGDPSKLEGEAAVGAGYRTANAAGRLSELGSGETLLSNESIQKAFAEMFEGVVVDVPLVDQGIDDAASR